jgi:hypothetical protein
MTMHATIYLLPDAREKGSFIQDINDGLRGHAVPGGFRGGSYLTQYPFAWTARIIGDVDMNDVLTAIKAVDWEYPAMVIHRSSDEFRWNHCLVGLHREMLPED